MSINVKVSRTKLISSLQEKVALLVKEIDDLPTRAKQVKDERRRLAVAFVKMIKSIPQEQFVNEILNRSGGHLTIQQTCPAPYIVNIEASTFHLKEKIALINNAINILNLSSEETVSTKTYSEVMSYF